ncbi:E3 ubiquitin ligase [Elasticomyces elasticus]|nr:E3 ubiquitin ligase [Elasticomyces elasticus]
MASTTGNLPHYNDGNARKRLKTSRNGGTASPAPSNTSAIMARPTANPTNGESSTAHIHDGNCHHESALKTLHGDVDAMRTLVSCQICQRFMYEPYALSCGHTYCYSCLNQWLGSNAKTTCPDCRAVISQQPTPSYVIRELVLIFVSRTQLLPDGETAEEHDNMAKEEAALVARDKANADPRTGGLFKGSFKAGSRRNRLMPMYDPEDAVQRCPGCHWELEGNYCAHCQMAIGATGLSDYDDSTTSEDEMDQELIEDFDADHNLGMHGPVHVNLDTEDEDDMWGDEVDDVDGEMDEATLQAAFGGIPRRAMAAGHHRHGRHAVVTITSDEDSDEDDDEHDSDLERFIDDQAREDEEHEGLLDSSDTEVQEIPRARLVQCGHVVISDDEDEGVGRTQDDAISLESSDDEAPVLGTAGRTKRNRVMARPRAVVITSDEDSSDSDDESVAQPAPAFTNGGFSPLQEGSDDEESSPAVTFHFEDHELEDTSDASSAPPVYYHEDFPETSSVDDEASDNGIENGYESASTTSTAEPAEAVDNNHRLQINGQHRHRSHWRPLPQPTSYRSPVVAVPRRPQASNHFAGPARTSYAASSRRAATAPNHPFQLSNTLADINSRSRRGQVEPETESERSRSPSQRSVSESAVSTSSAVGGVDVEDPSSPTTGSESSSGSSRTIGRATQPVAPQRGWSGQRVRQIPRRQGIQGVSGNAYER